MILKFLNKLIRLSMFVLTNSSVALFCTYFVSIFSAGSPHWLCRRGILLLLLAGLRRGEATAQLERREELLQGRHADYIYFQFELVPLRNYLRDEHVTFSPCSPCASTWPSSSRSASRTCSTTESARVRLNLIHASVIERLPVLD